jgi:hypothetical protein
VIQRDNFNADLSGMPPAVGYRRGDLNLDGKSDRADLFAFKAAYEAANPGSSFAALVGGTGVPEPSALGMVLLASGGVTLRRRSWRSRMLLVTTAANRLATIGA